MQLPSKGNTLLKNKVVLHAMAWVTAFMVFFISFLGIMETKENLLTLLIFFIPATGVVYFHFYLIETFLYRKKYLLYVVLTLGSVFIGGQLTNFLFQDLLYKDDPDARATGVLTIGVFVLVSTGIRFFYNGVKQQLDKQELETKQVKTELNILKSQVHPHFLFNSLNNIYGLTLEQPDIVGETIMKLSSLMRYILESTQKTKVNLTEEVQFLKNYIAMERLRLGEKCRIDFNTQGEFNQIKIEPMLFIPFVENSFKHGSFKTIRESYIDIKLSLNQDKISFCIRNSVNIKQEPGIVSTETGIDNVKRRLKILYPDKHEINIIKNDLDFQVSLEIEI